MADAKYEVGQVVVISNDFDSNNFEVGSHVVYFGMPGDDSESCHVSREGRSEILDLATIRPLAPGELPTIDGRGYPIEAKAGRTAELKVKLPGFAEWASESVARINEVTASLRELDATVKEHHCQGAESRTCPCPRLHPGQCASSKADAREPCWDYLQALAAQIAPHYPEPPADTLAAALAAVAGGMPSGTTVTVTIGRPA